jgi:hypothetical protein
MSNKLAQPWEGVGPVADGAGGTAEDGDVAGTTVGRGVLAGCGVLVLGAGCGVLVLGAGLADVVAGRDLEGAAAGEAVGCAGGETIACGGLTSA